MEYLAHSAKGNISAQSYQEHVLNVREAAVRNAKAAAHYAVLDGDMLEHVVETAACVHDLGKLHEENQAALRKAENRSPLPVNHVDAGVVCLQKCPGISFNAQAAVYSHHRGLPDMKVEGNRGEDFFRDDKPKVRNLVNDNIEELKRLHRKLLPDMVVNPNEAAVKGDGGMFYRLMLSCLADADHSDTARNYQNAPEDSNEPLLRAEERLNQLDAYVAELAKQGGDSERNQLRMEMYQSCRDADASADIVACDSPVGSGKTTAIMAHLLRQAVHRKARRIFVVLPFTNIIRQSVETYRKALILPDEDCERVVAELHYRADFENEDSRALTAQWRTPIIVTTAVAFFETLASNRPAALRRLHELPGSLIFVDEAHAALPVKLLPISWHWMQVLADEWSCYWLLASGSLVEFWKLEAEEWKKKERQVPQLLSVSFRKHLMNFEGMRIRFCYVPKPLSRKDLIERVTSAPGPRLLIMNTVQSAAILALDLQDYYGGGETKKVMHLSTALNAQDRNKIVRDVTVRLKDANDTDWTLVATSCVEAGVDFSFKTGFREMASLLSLLQAAGRVNRNGIDSDAEIWSFVMQDDPDLKENPGLKTAAVILWRDYFEKGVEIQPDLSTDSMQRELDKSSEDLKILLRAEEHGQFPTVEQNFRVIDDETVLVVADEDLKTRIRYGGGDWREIQKKAASVRKYYVNKYDLKPLADGLYDWQLGYDNFLGVMRGVLLHQKNLTGTLIV